MTNEASNAATEPPSHDKVFKILFQAFFRDVMELLHPEVAEALALDDVEFINELVFADLSRYGEVIADLVAKTTTRQGDPRLVLVHFEIEGRYRASMEQRMWRYFLHLSLKFDLPIVSIVVFLKGGAPGAQRRDLVRKVGSWEASRFSYLSFGLSGSLAEEWVARPQRLAAALAALMRSEIWDRVEQKLQCLRAIVGEGDDRRRFMLSKVVETYLELQSEDERVRFEQALAAEPDEVKTMVITWDEALAEREQLGEARGEAHGRLDATRQAIGLLLDHRFKSTPASIKTALDKVEELARLQEILERALDVPSLEQLQRELGLSRA